MFVLSLCFFLSLSLSHVVNNCIINVKVIIHGGQASHYSTNEVNVRFIKNTIIYTQFYLYPIKDLINKIFFTQYDFLNCRIKIKIICYFFFFFFANNYPIIQKLFRLSWNQNNHAEHYIGCNFPIL